MQQAVRETLEQCMRSQQLPQLSNVPQVCLLEHRTQPHTAEVSNTSVVHVSYSGLVHDDPQADSSFPKNRNVGRYTWGICTSAHLDNGKPVM